MWGVRWAVESLTIGLANDFMYGPITATAIWAGGLEKLESLDDMYIHIGLP